MRRYEAGLQLRLQLRCIVHLFALVKSSETVACGGLLFAGELEPIAFYATTGTDEPNTKFIKDEAQRLGVKYCVLDHAADNGCDTNITIPQATSATHVSTEFEGCDDYPVKFGSFQGQLSYAQKDPGSSVNWIAAETWEFFMRF